MYNFTFHNPVAVVFGKGTIEQLGKLIPKQNKVMITYGGGSIKENKIYDKVMDALSEHDVTEFGGIEPNPRYETLIKAVQKGRNENISFLVPVGGGSVYDGTKFIAAAIPFRTGDPWDIVKKHAFINEAIPLGGVLTLPATGSEMNDVAVISREETKEKLPFSDPLVFPKFSILDPETTFTLPKQQVANGIIDTFAHVIEQYLTFDVNSPVQDRFSEGIILTIIEESPKVMSDPRNYEVRANLMWSATLALNGLLAAGVPQDWSSHMIGHELTAEYGIDHAQSLAVVIPAVMEYRKEKKRRKLMQYGARVWNIKEGRDEEIIDRAIQKTKEFFQSLGAGIKLSDYDIGNDAPEIIQKRFEKDGRKLGEYQDITSKEVKEILELCI